MTFGDTADCQSALRGKAKGGAMRTIIMNEEANLPEYYARRAKEYERIYHKPERQEDLAKLKELLPRTFARERVLEIACGTGYWTEVLAGTASSVTATDINEE